jgi:hypothetical protein
VYLIHHDPETTGHDLVDFFGIKLFGHRDVVGDISEKNCDHLTLTFNGGATGEDFVGQELGGV